jgi:hypothetical protein
VGVIFCDHCGFRRSAIKLSAEDDIGDIPTICGNCGKLFSDSDIFCGKCGAERPGKTAPTVGVPASSGSVPAGLKTASVPRLKDDKGVGGDIAPIGKAPASEPGTPGAGSTKTPEKENSQGGATAGSDTDGGKAPASEPGTPGADGAKTPEKENSQGGAAAGNDTDGGKAPASEPGTPGADSAKTPEKEDSQGGATAGSDTDGGKAPVSEPGADSAKTPEKEDSQGSAAAGDDSPPAKQKKDAKLVFKAPADPKNQWTGGAFAAKKDAKAPTQAHALNFCGKCGHAFKENDVFCGKCGAPRKLPSKSDTKKKS